MKNLQLHDIIIYILLILAVIFLIHGHIAEKSASNQNDLMIADENTAKEQYSRKVSRVRKQFFNNALTSKDPILRSIALNSYEQNAVNAPFNRFFNVYYNYANHSQYINRAKKLRGIATATVLKARDNLNHHYKYFDNDKDKNGNSIIDNEEQHSKFDNVKLYIDGKSGSTLTVIADVQYTSWYSGQIHNMGEKWYCMNYNMSSKKITGIESLCLDKLVKSNVDAKQNAINS